MAGRDKEHALWRQIWREGEIPFHRDDVHPDLVRFGDELLAGGPHRVLVPLCGKSVDLAWLAERGHRVIGVELVEDAVRAFFREHDLEFDRERLDGHIVYRSGSIEIVCGDFFEVDRSHVGAVNRIWDRAAMIALPGHLRGDYTRHVRQLGAPGWVMLLSAVEYDTSVMSGPPYSVAEAEVRSHLPGASVEVLDRRDAIDSLERLRQRGHRWWRESAYLIRDGSTRDPSRLP
jgi:thiopurine S-methyltransferase